MEETVSKKQKIIISIVAIFLVLITLLGITYAYFVTRMNGNTNENSVIISTAKLELVYNDGNGLIEVKEKIEPGTTIETKTFTVENNGTHTIENYAVYVENIINNFERTQDVRINITCKAYDTINKKYLENNCNGLTDGTYPILNSKLVSNSIDVGIRHEYELTINYVNEEEIDQSNDMNKTIKGKIQIYDLNDSVDITGTIANVQEGDYVVLGDNIQISQIVNGTYKIVGILPETYTIHLKNNSKNESGETTTVTKGSKTILFERGEEEKLEGNTLYITTSSDAITLNITNIIDNELVIEKGN